MGERGGVRCQVSGSTHQATGQTTHAHARSSTGNNFLLLLQECGHGRVPVHVGADGHHVLKVANDTRELREGTVAPINGDSHQHITLARVAHQVHLG